MSELKPCPFCGGEAKFNGDGDSNFSYIANGAAWVSCLNCEAEGATIFTDKDEISVMESDRVSKLAIDSWNTRAADSQLTTITKQRDELINIITEQEKVIGDLEKEVERLTLEKLAAINFDYYSKQSKGE